MKKNFSLFIIYLVLQSPAESIGLPLINDRENRNTKNCIFKKLDLAASKVYHKLLSPIIQVFF